MNEHLIEMQRSILVTVLKNEKENHLKAAPGLAESASLVKVCYQADFFLYLDLI